MKLGRSLFGLCHIGHTIYVVGGRSNYKSEKFDTKMGKWSEVFNGRKLDDLCYGLTVAVVS